MKKALDEQWNKPGVMFPVYLCKWEFAPKLRMLVAKAGTKVRLKPRKPIRKYK